MSAFKKRREEKIWQMWIALYPHMTEKNFQPFSEFYRKNTTPDQPVTHKTKEEILADADMILRALQKDHLKGR